jgi:hypothetical protein
VKRNAFLLIVCLSIALTFCSSSSPTTYAAGGPEVEGNRAEADFPDSVTFYLSVSSQAVIDTIELEYGVTQVTCGAASAKATPDFDPATRAKVSWTWDFRKSNSPPPGARIWWRWHVMDEAGNELGVEEQEIYFDDPRYDWQEIRSDELAFLSAVPDQDVNQGLWQAANEALDRLESDIGARPERQVKIHNYPSTQDVRDAVVFTRQWTGGLARTSYDTILLGVNRSNLEWGERAMAHELTHLVVYQVTFNCLGDLPTWLDEGLAEYIEGDLASYSQEILDAALADDDLISLQSLSSSFPTSSKRTSLAYAQSRQIVSYLIETYGPEKMGALLQTFKEGSSYDKALQRVYGLNTQDLYNEWRASLGLPPQQIVATATPISLPTLAPYGASTPTAAAISAPTLTLPPPTATATAVPTSPLTATPTTQPIITTLPTSTLTLAAPAAAQIVTFPLALIIGVVMIVGALVAILIRLQSLRC